MSDSTTLTLPVLPLRNGVVFPGMVVTIALESSEARRAVSAAQDGAGRVLLVPRIEGEYAKVGTVAAVEQVETSGAVRGALVRGLARARVGAGQIGGNGALMVDIEILDEPLVEDPEQIATLAAEYRAVIGAILEHRGVAALAERLLAVDDPGELADLAAYSPDLTLAQKVELLETLSVERRLTLLLDWMGSLLGELSLREKVREDAAERLDKSQREYVLRQQMAAIRKELGEEDGDVAGEYRTKLEEADLPPKVRDAVAREIDRLERVGEQSPEHSWIRTWLDTMFDLPWGTTSEDHLELEDARQVLDADHTGLEDVKERILEHLAVRKLRQERGVQPEEGRRAGAILLLAGPPGVGKTSLGESVARAMGRAFVRVALGGVHDEAEIRGHRRTYVGARPGRIARALVEAGTMNPVFLLDEMDKVGADWRGDPSSALLEVLDPAQNHTFRDHYLEVDLDLSDVLFIGTANVLETIPAPLLDRTEVIRIDGYTDVEKVEIARRHLLGRQVDSAGLRSDEIEVTDGALDALIDGYTREAGVRGLERVLGKLVRKVATKVAAGNEVPVVVDRDDLRELVGRPTVYREEAADRTEAPGVVTGLAVTGTGGDILFVEAQVMEGEPGLAITGQLGDVMKESAQIALSYVRSHAVGLGIDPADLEKRFHLHVPAGAVPKDGPSAGIAMTTALVSLLTGRRVRHDLAMTGEITLQGRVLPIGGLKQKVLAAHRGGIRQVILPLRNEHDLDDVPESVRTEMTFHPVDEVGTVIELALEPATGAVQAA